jgi:hypothetical protein
MADISLWQTAAVSVGSALVGGAFVHILAGRRDRDTKRRELVTKHLIELWRKIDAQNSIATAMVGDPEPDLSGWSEIVGDIQLFGSERQVELIHKVAHEINTDKFSDTTELLNGLRSSLRKELGLPEPKLKYIWFRANRKNANSEIENKTK